MASQRAQEAVVELERCTEEVETALESIHAAQAANSPERWHEARAALDAALRNARWSRDSAHDHVRDGELKTDVTALCDRLGLLERDAAGMIEAPTGVVTISREREIAIILTAQVGGSAAGAHEYKERLLVEELSRLPVEECKVLAMRFRRKRTNDELAELFGRWTVQRRDRVLAFLDNARRREAMRREPELRRAQAS